MGLDLREAAVVDDEQLEMRAESVYDMLDTIKSQMQDQLGVDDMPAPKDLPKPLAEVDVASIGNRELGAIYTQYVAYSVFLNSRLAEMISLEKAARGNLKKATAEIKNQLRADGVKAADIAARVETHPVYEEYYIEWLKLFMMKEILEARYKAYRDMAAALSRNVTLRELEFEQQRRDSNVQSSKGSSRPRRSFGGRRG
jgi:desulfoferrodoxin (superoxide reductase-like protein)